MVDIRLVEILVQLVWVVEVLWRWPRQEEEVLVRLLAKATGGYRPIMLFRSLFRMVGKVKANTVKNWLAAITREFHEVNMAPRRWVTDATFCLQVGRDLGISCKGSGALELAGAEVQWDLIKAFDRVNWDKLVSRAKEWGYPLEALRLSMTSCSWKRRLVMDGVVGKGIYPTKGVAAGSPFAPFELALVVLPTIVRLRSSGIPLALSIYVDDFMISATGQDEDQMASRMVKWAAMVYDEITSVGFVVERAKGFVLGSSRQLAARLGRSHGQVRWRCCGQCQQAWSGLLVGPEGQWLAGLCWQDSLRLEEGQTAQKVGPMVWWH